MVEIEDPREPTFDDFIRKVEPLARKGLEAYGIPPEDAEDLLQQAFLAVLYQWELFESSGQAAQRLSRILVSACSMYKRQRRATDVSGQSPDGRILLKHAREMTCRLMEQIG
jgi:DNA-directed RNA polymerase specialized sigma24 family protein